MQAFQELQELCPAHHNDPLLLLPGIHSHIVVDIPFIRKEFSLILQHIGLSSKDYSLHSLRRGGASVSFQAGVSAAAVQKHGLWRSEAFWQYVITPVSSSPVAAALTDALQVGSQ